ncbi:MAG: Holliday junction resolvase RuvX [Candidatus Ornithomonoglobus sp.]
MYDGNIEYVDERLTTMGAARFLNTTNTRGEKRKKVIDTVSACLILESYLAKQKNND